MRIFGEGEQRVGFLLDFPPLWVGRGHRGGTEGGVRVLCVLVILDVIIIAKTIYLRSIHLVFEELNIIFLIVECVFYLRNR